MELQESNGNVGVGGACEGHAQQGCARRRVAAVAAAPAECVRVLGGCLPSSSPLCWLPSPFPHRCRPRGIQIHCGSRRGGRGRVPASHGAAQARCRCCNPDGVALLPSDVIPVDLAHTRRSDSARTDRLWIPFLSLLIATGPWRLRPPAMVVMVVTLLPIDEESLYR
jgi:hypothetical protein